MIRIYSCSRELSGFLTMGGRGVSQWLGSLILVYMYSSVVVAVVVVVVVVIIIIIILLWLEESINISRLS